MKKTLLKYRKELSSRFRGRNNPPKELANDIEYFISQSLMPIGIKEIAECFNEVGVDALREAIRWLIWIGKVACDPSETRYRKYWIDKDYLSEKKEKLEEKPAPKQEKRSARDTVLSLDPTIVNQDVINVIDEEIARLSAIKMASMMNTDNNNNIMVSIQEGHVVIVLTPKDKPYTKIRQFLGRLDTFSQLNEGLFFDLQETESHE